MSINLSDSQTITEIASKLRDFLPGTPHPYADKSLSFQGVSISLGLKEFWSGGSKLPAITTLLEKTLEYKRDRFCDLIIKIIRCGLKYRNNKGNPIMKEEILGLNSCILKVNFKIPELWDNGFLNSLPSREKKEEKAKQASFETSLENLKNEFLAISRLEPQQRGYEFEKFLKKLFDFYNLDARASFRLEGEQIDGSFQFDNETYLIEAKWQDKQTSQQDLLVFQGKIEGKAKWSRGLFISFSGFVEEGLAAFSRGRCTHIIGMTGQDLYLIFENKISLVDALHKKSRRAAETGKFYVPVLEY